MTPRFVKTSATLLALICFSAIAFAYVANIDVQTFETELLKSIKEKFNDFFEKAPDERLYVQTDKTFYRPGETVWLTAYVRDGKTLKASNNSDIVHVEFINPKGAVEKHYKLVAKNGSATGDFDLSGIEVGGIYKIKAYTNYQKNDTKALAFEKEITIQKSVLPRLKMKLEFEKKAYGKGDEVVAKLELNTNENKPLANKSVKFKAQLAGIALSEKTVTTDAEGKTKLTFTLPKDLSTIDGLVNALIDFEGSTESVSRSVPIVLNQIKMEFFPEGGDMVNNMPGKVAFRAVNEFGKAADVSGVIVNQKGEPVTSFTSYHFGMGAATFTPRPNETYKARITKPEGILDEFELPEALPAGYVLSANKRNNDEVAINIKSTTNEVLTLVGQTRGKIYFSGSFNAAKGDNNIYVSTDDFPIGVAQFTLFDSKGIARAERMVFVNQNKQLKVSVTPDKQQYKPREKVTMSIKVTDENNIPVPGTFSLSVVDDNLLSFADDKQGNILAKMLLEPELKETVEEANFYFNAKEPKSEQALDYLMLTAGWRRYTWKDIDEQEYPAITYNAEKAELGGVILDANTGKPVEGAQVKFKGTAKVYYTDASGKFLIKKYNIAQSNNLEISKEGFMPQNTVVSEYSKSLSYYLYNNTYTYGWGMQEDAAVPVAAGAVNQKFVPQRAELMEEVVVANRKPMAKMKKDDADKLYKNEDEGDFKVEFADVAEVPAEKALERRKADDAEPIDQTEIEEENTKTPATIVVGDYRQAILQKNEGNNSTAIYYRAKEFPKRVYKASDTTRNDFGTTVYWNGNIETDRNGRAKVEFLNNDAITSYRATLEGFTNDGGIAHTETNYSTQLPFSMDAKIPSDLVSGDKMMIPVFLKNNTDEEASGKMFITTPVGLNILNKIDDVKVGAKEAKVVYLECVATDKIGDGTLQVKFVSDKFNDVINKQIHIVPKGFPANISLSGQDLDKDFIINPTAVVSNSIKVTFNAYPNVMSELMSGVESILQEPYGCFEQTSSSNYPNIMVLNYMKTMKVNDPKLEARAKDLLERGYKRLISYETKENGYEWFGAAPAHEALTAYGLMEFEDMKGVYNGVDQGMIDRTAKLLLDKRDGNGGFKKNPRALDSFGGADEDITNAYIVYALTEAGHKADIEKELNAAYKNAVKENDPYLLALVANAMYNVGNAAKGDELVNKLVNMRQEANGWTGKRHSITRSGGQSLTVETTSLVVLAMLKAASPNTEAITSAVKHLVGARSGYGGFGTTQGTILALKALSKYAEFSKKTDEAGTIEVLVDGTVVASKSYDKGQRDNLTIDGLDKFVKQGKQKISIRYKGAKNALPYTMNVSYSTTLPQSSKDCVASLETKLNTKQVKVGETVRLTVSLKNKTNTGQPMTMAIIGIPAGLSAQPWQLKEMQDKGVFDFYELIDNNVVCYYRDMAPGESMQINLDLKAEIPGQFDAPASSAYLYYTPEFKTWVSPERIFVNP
jgi:hypothetical protein